MKYFLLYIFLKFNISCKIFKQNEQDSRNEKSSISNSKKDSLCIIDTIINHNRDTIYSITQVPPSYKGGIDEVLKYIRNNFNITDNTIFSYRIKIIIFSNSEIKVVSINDHFDSTLTDSEKKLRNIIESMKSWSPAKCNNTNVNSVFILPLKL